MHSPFSNLGVANGLQCQSDNPD